MPRTIIVKKRDGTSEPFNVKKLIGSLENSGAEDDVIKHVIEHIDREMYDGITTDWIYSHAFELLKKTADQPSRFRYSLRRAVGGLGPSGFPFEKFVAEVFAEHGYNTRVGQKLKGACVTHEVDVIAENAEEVITAELKFHNKLFIKTDLKVAMYVDSRFKDIRAAGYYGEKRGRPFLVTNTKFSSNAITYAECGATLELMSWSYPKRGFGNLHDLIQKAQIHPVTALTSLSKKDILRLLDAGFVSCKDLKKGDGKDVLDTGIISKDKLDKVMSEVETICGAKP